MRLVLSLPNNQIPSTDRSEHVLQPCHIAFYVTIAALKLQSPGFKDKHKRMTYRRHFILLLMTLNRSAKAGLRFGGEEWTLRFRQFMKELNEFIIELNDNKLDERKWRRVCQAWSALDEP